MLQWRDSWWRHQMDTFSALLALCEGNPSVTGGFPSQRPVTRSFDVFFDLLLNKRLRKHSRRQRLRTTPWSLWRHCNVKSYLNVHIFWPIHCCYWLFNDSLCHLLFHCSHFINNRKNLYRELEQTSTNWKQINDEQKLLLLLGMQFSDSVLNICCKYISDLYKVREKWKTWEKSCCFQYD